MKTAYKINEETGGYIMTDSGSGPIGPRLFYADDFSAEDRPDGHYACSCGCKSKVIWRRQTRSNGNNAVDYQPRMWIPKSRKVNLKNKCQNIRTASHSYKKASLSTDRPLNDVIADPSMKILIRLNFDTRAIIQEFNKGQTTTDRLWCRAHKGQYKSIPARSTDDVIKFLNKFFDQAPPANAVDRVMISHTGYTRTLSEVLLSTPEKRLYKHNTLKNIARHSRYPDQFRRSTFPCIIPLGLAYSERKNFTGTPQHCFNMTSDPNIVHEAYRFRDKMNPENLLAKTGWAIAWPYTNNKNPNKLMWYIHGENNMTERSLHINSQPKHQPAPMIAAE